MTSSSSSSSQLKRMGPFRFVAYLKDLLTSLLRSFGLYQKEGTILLLGLDNAGKTTFLHKLRTDTFRDNYFEPTERPHVEQFQMEGIRFAGWDLGGHEAVRHLWEDYVMEESISAVLYMIDASDEERLAESALELDALVNGDGDGDGEGLLNSVPLAILLNKCDLSHAMRSEDMADGMEYDEIVEKLGEEKVRMFRMSVVRGEGYQEAFQWIATFL